MSINDLKRCIANAKSVGIPCPTMEKYLRKLEDKQSETIECPTNATNEHGIETQDSAQVTHV